MSTTLHRSENLTLTRNGATVTVDLRFPNSFARGTVDVTCPKCGMIGTPEQWELEGPDSRGNSMWIRCGDGCADRGTRWLRTVSFDAWVETG